MLELDRVLVFDPTREEEFFAGLPSRAGILALDLRAPNGAVVAEPYLVRTADLKRAAERVLRRPDAPTKRLNLRELAIGVKFRVSGSRFEQALAHYQNARHLFPQRYRDMVRLRPPALLKLNLRNPYPRCYVTRRILGDGGMYVGPFVTRKSADEFANRFLDLFKVRRCQIRIRRDPNFPGCIYSEMKMCLAPCFAGCTAEEYDREAERLAEALASRGETTLSTLENERDAASTALEFETAASLQKRLEKVKENVRGLPEIARPVQNLDAVILQKAAKPNSVAVFAIRGCLIADPLFLDFDEQREPKSAEEILRVSLEACDDKPADPKETDLVAPEPLKLEYRARFAMPSPAPELKDHLALIARWYYSNPRSGEIFFPEKSWPYRRILRACSRVLAGAQKNSENRGMTRPSPSAS